MDTVCNISELSGETGDGMERVQDRDRDTIPLALPDIRVTFDSRSSFPGNSREHSFNGDKHQTESNKRQVSETTLVDNTGLSEHKSDVPAISSEVSSFYDISYCSNV